MSFKWRILVTLKSMLLTLTYTLKPTTEEDWKQSYTTRNDFTFPIVNFTFISSNIPAAPAYGAYISQLIRYSYACAQNIGFLDKTQQVGQQLLTHDDVTPRLKS